MAEFFILKSRELNIHLNAKNINGYTPFHFACNYGNLNIAEMLVQKSVELNIKLNEKEKKEGNTGFHMACIFGKMSVVEMLINNVRML